MLVLVRVLRVWGPIRRRRKKVEPGSKAVSEPAQAESGGVVSLTTTAAVLKRVKRGEGAQNGEILPRRKVSERERVTDEPASAAVPFADLKVALRGVCTRRRGLHLCVRAGSSSSDQGPEPGSWAGVATFSKRGTHLRRSLSRQRACRNRLCNMPVRVFNSMSSRAAARRRGHRQRRGEKKEDARRRHGRPASAVRATFGTRCI